MDGVEGAGEAGDESEGCGRGVVSGVDEAFGAGRVSWGASSPVLWMMRPSLRERIRVDCTPGREVRWDRSAVTC